MPTALEEARTPPAARRVAAFVLVAAVALPAALSFLPWPHVIPVKGRVVAGTPLSLDRGRSVAAPADGVVAAWRVKAEEWVKVGDVLVEITDTSVTAGTGPTTGLADAERRAAELRERVAGADAAKAKQSEAAKSAGDAAGRAVDAGKRAQVVALQRLDAAKADLAYREADFKAYRDAGGAAAVGNVEDLRRDAARKAAETKVVELEAEVARLDVEIRDAKARVTAAEADGERDAQALARQATQDAAGLRAAEERVVALKARPAPVITPAVRQVRAPVAGRVTDVPADARKAGAGVKGGQLLLSIVPAAAGPAAGGVEVTLRGPEADAVRSFHAANGAWPAVKLEAADGQPFAGRLTGVTGETGRVQPDGDRPPAAGAVTGAVDLGAWTLGREVRQRLGWN